MALHDDATGLLVTPDGSIELQALPPFDLRKTVEALRRRPPNLADTLVESERDGQGPDYRRVVALGDGLRLISVRQVAPDRVRARILAREDGADSTLDAQESAELATTLRRLLGLAVDLAPVYDALAPLAAPEAEDTWLAPLARLAGELAGLKPPRYLSLWHAFLGVVPFQQVSLHAGAAMLNRVIERLGARLTYDGRVYYALPSPEALLARDEAFLRDCGLSAAKTRTLQGAAAALLDGRLAEAEIEALDDAEALARLTTLPGIGAWSAQAILLRGFGRLSLYPLKDSGAASTLQKLLGLDAAATQRAEQALLERLGAWRGYLYFLLLGWRLLQSGVIAPANSAMLSTGRIGRDAEPEGAFDG